MERRGQAKSARSWRNFVVCTALIVVGLLSGAGNIGPVPDALAVDELDYGLEEQSLSRIVLHGNQTFPDNELKSVLQIRERNWLHPFSQARYRPDLIDIQLRLLERYYQQRGFHQVIVNHDSTRQDPRSRGDMVYISVVEGSRTILDAVIFSGEDPLRERDLQRVLQYRAGEPSPADLSDFGQDLYRLRNLYWDRAFLDVSIEPILRSEPTLDSNRFSASIEYRISPGIRYQIRQIRIRGTTGTRPDLIEREFRVYEGGPLAWGEIDRSRRQLLETGLLRDVSFTPVNFDSTAGTADLEVQVVERKPAYYELGAGIGSRERVRLLGAWGHNNLWGSGRRLFLRGRGYWNVEEIIGSSRATPRAEFNYRGDITYVNPHLRGSQFRLDINLFAEKETRGESGLNLEKLGFRVGTQFHGGDQVLNTVAFQFEESNPNPHPDADSTTVALFEASDITKTQTRSLVYTFFEEKRNNVFQPTRGSLISAQLELAGGIMAGDNSFVRVLVNSHYYTHCFLGGSLAIRVGMGVVRPYGQSLERGVPYSDRFFAGGGSSVRGYLENSLGPQITDPAVLDALQLTSDVPLPDNPARGGNYLMLTNVEWRFPLPLLSRWKLNGVFFMDGGNVWQRIEDIQLRGFRLRSYPREPDAHLATKIWDYRYSVGSGIRLNTPVGPFRFDVGIPLKRAPEDDSIMYHFSLGYPF
ncbi:MAG: BamA/TamA family outer membrane protein [bacterium]